MNPPVSALRPASDVPGEVQALDGVLAHLGEVIDTLDLDYLSRLDGDTVLTVLAKTAALGRGVEAILSAASAEVAVRSDPVRGSEGLAARLNFAQPSHLIEMVAGVSAATAARLMRVGSRTSPRATDSGLPLPPLFPAVGEAMKAGLIGVETAEVITRELTVAAPRAEVEELAVAERILVGQATGSGDDAGLPMPPDLIAIQARQWRDRLDQDGTEPRADKAFQNRDFWVSRTPVNGLVKFGGKVTVDVGAKLQALFNSILTPRSAPRFLADEEEADRSDAANDATTTDATVTDATLTDAATRDAATRDATIRDATITGGSTEKSVADAGSGPTRPAGSDQRVPKETRTPGQIRADVFAAMIDSLARSTDVPTVSGAAPTVVVRVTAEVLKKQKGTGEIVGVSDLIPYSTIKQILCDGSVLPAVIDPDGALVALGTEQRRFNRPQRMGMIARDGPTCGIPGCMIPATACEAHHIIEHHEQGKTHTDNGALYCWFHHRMIDTGVFSVEMVDGRPVVTIPDWLLRKPYFQ
ncbi:DUF222 domain-containing protein [Mycetocola sp. 2940]|uniref:HNH endonuclease signature motif containing protein n=1 Tax=Mycetocola sp. 2940 TaxID=3156452 RepID=UPI003397A1DD